mmetsp:Transcript_17143/g.42327  ORF Transcript_17143/g.42327 Transcript_17143/m.42327 type:complete len:258 (+) Transcript_17143:1151-1924(+)
MLGATTVATGATMATGSTISVPSDCFVSVSRLSLPSTDMGVVACLGGSSASWILRRYAAAATRGTVAVAKLTKVDREPPPFLLPPPPLPPLPVAVEGSVAPLGSDLALADESAEKALGASRGFPRRRVAPLEPEAPGVRGAPAPLRAWRKARAWPCPCWATATARSRRIPRGVPARWNACCACSPARVRGASGSRDAAAGTEAPLPVTAGRPAFGGAPVTAVSPGFHPAAARGGSGCQLFRAWEPRASETPPPPPSA